MNFDPNNPVVKLCAQGMQTEATGDTEAAHTLFEQAWQLCTTNFERFTAAHYLARNQPTPKENLYWNKETLRYALLIDDKETKGHLPSLYLNIGKAYETLKQTHEAQQNYQLALEYSDALPQNNYGDMLRTGIAQALKRVGIIPYANTPLDDLINHWCTTKQLQPLAFILPAYVGNLGTQNDINKILSALSRISATRCISSEEQTTVEQLISHLSSQ